uniref:Uncharacterized protein n=1 Tax=Aegilops tauschii subsp. strangulata TaxID=200361 RepID=A0A453M5Y1_AEGTS
VVVCQTTSGPPCTGMSKAGTILYSRGLPTIRGILAVNHALAQRSECINQTEVLASLLVKDAAVRAYRTDPVQ